MIIIFLLLITLQITQCHGNTAQTFKHEIDTVLATDDYFTKRKNMSDPEFRHHLDVIEALKAVCKANQKGRSQSVTFTKVCLQSFFNEEGSVLFLSPEKFPRFCTAVSEIVQKSSVSEQFVFLVEDAEFMNATAISLGSSSLIFIGKGLIDTFSDDAIRAVLAHEIAHIALHHSTKKLFLVMGELSIIATLLGILWCNLPNSWGTFQDKVPSMIIGAVVLLLIKQFIDDAFSCVCEQEADVYAFSALGDASLERFFEEFIRDVHKRQEKYTQDCCHTLQALKSLVDKDCNVAQAMLDTLRGRAKELEEKSYRDIHASGDHPSIRERLERMRALRVQRASFQVH